MKKFIAERKLLYSPKGSDIRKEFIIGISTPYLIDKSMVDHPVGEGVAACRVELNGLDEEYPEVYGADTLQAINLASDVEHLLKRLQKKIRSILAIR